MSTAAVFLSYASQDAEAVARIAEALRAGGVEVWFDKNELVGGDAWDQKIRGQIKSCALFVPVISAATQARREGYFRLEWKLAAQRTHMISERQAFLLPVVIDATSDAAADVPEEFRAVQWTRLPGGETPAAFCARVGKLLGGDAVAGVPEVAARSVRTREDGRVPAAPPRQPSRPGLVPSVAAATLLVAGAAYFALRPRTGGESATAAAVNLRAVASPAGETGPRAEVAALMERVRALTRKTDVVRVELDAAVGLLEEAAKLDQKDPEVWALWALIDCRYASEYLDRSTARFDLAQRHATQAISLDPKSPAARLAQATAMTLLSRDSATKLAAIALLAPLVEEQGDRADALILLANLKWDLGNADEASAYLDRAAKFPGRIGQVHYQRATRYLFSGQGQQSLEEIDRALAAEPAAKFQLWKSYLLMIWQGDVEGAKRVFREIPPAMLVEDFPAGARYFVALWARDYDGAVAALRVIPRDYLEAGAIRGPTGYYKGYALARSGKPVAAETEWRAALQVVERRLGVQPNERVLLSLKALLLKSLGETAAAGKIWRTVRELYGDSIDQWEDHFARLEILPDDEAIDYLVKSAKEALPVALAASLRLNPFVDRLRTNPRFVEFMAQIEGDPRLSPQAKPVAAAGTTALDPKSVAVLAFANRSDDAANEIFSDGISEELINVLGRVPGLTVKGRASSFYFKNSAATAQEKGQKLGATFLVDGSVRKMGNTVRITAQVIRAATDEVVWSSEPLVREVKDVFAVQEEIAGMIAKALSLKLGVGSAAAKAELNPEVYRLYLEGREALRQRTAAGSVKAEQLFRQVLALDPNFARGHAALADVWALRAQRENTAGQLRNRNDALMDQAMAGARQALLLDPNLAEAHSALGSLLWMDWKLDEAIREHRAAVALNPSDASAHQRLGRVLLTDGRVDEALESLRRAHELDPLFARIADNYSVALISARRLEEAVAMANRALALQPELRQALAFKAVALADLGRKEEVLAAARRYAERPGALEQDGTPSMVAYALARVKATGESELLLAQVPEGKRQTATAAAWLELGKREEAFAVLRAGNSNVTAADTLLWWPVFDAVREEPEFKATIAAMGLTEAHARAQAWRAKQQAAK